MSKCFAYCCADCVLNGDCLFQDNYDVESCDEYSKERIKKNEEE